MRYPSTELLKSVIYYGIAIALLLGGWAVFTGGALTGNTFITIGGLLVGCGLLLGAAILLAFPLARALSDPWGKLMFPDAKFDRPQPLYSLAEAQARREEYEKAITTYQKIATDFPQEVRPWIGMVEIAVMALKDVERADDIYQRGIAQFTDVETQESLARIYRGVRSRLNQEPDWGKKRTIDLVPSPRARRGTHRNFR